MMHPNLIVLKDMFAGYRELFADNFSRQCKIQQPEDGSAGCDRNHRY